MHKNWKKRLRTAIKDIKTNVMIHGLFLGFSSLLGIVAGEFWVFVLSMVISLFVLYAVYIEEICFAKNSMFDEEGKMEETFGVHTLLYPASREKEKSIDILSAIHTLLEEYEDDMTMPDTIFITELRGLLQTINYIKEEGLLSEIEEAEALIDIPMHWYDALQTYFAIFPTNRKELANELFLKTKEQREHIEKNYIQPHQDALIQQCKQKVDCIELKKREYLYIQD